MDPMLIGFLLIMVIMFRWMSKSAKKAQEKQRQERESAITLGTNVVTTSGFLGKIVDVDGDTITLESPSGTETVWLRSSIAQALDIPVAEISEEEAELLDAASTSDSADGDIDHLATDAEQPTVSKEELPVAHSESNDIK